MLALVRETTSTAVTDATAMRPAVTTDRSSMIDSVSRDW